MTDKYDEMAQKVLDQPFLVLGPHVAVELQVLIASALRQAVEEERDRLSKGWIPAETPPEDLEIVIALARLACKAAGGEHPMIVQWSQGAGWQLVTYLDNERYPIKVLAWMPRPEFEAARAAFSKE